MMSEGSNYFCGRPLGANPHLHASTWAWTLPFRVDVINGWLLSKHLHVGTGMDLSDIDKLVLFSIVSACFADNPVGDAW